MSTTHTSVIIADLPKCDFCERRARFVGHIKEGPLWAFMCLLHFRVYGIRLAPGRSQYIYTSEEERQEAEEYDNTYAI